MNQSLRIFSSLLLVATMALPLAGCSSSSEPQTVDELKALMASKKGELTSYALDTQMNMNMMGMSMDMTMAMQGMGDRMRGMLDMPAQGMNMDMVVDADGMMWIEMNMAGTKQVMKMDVAAVKDMTQQMMGMDMNMMGMGNMQHPMDTLTQMEQMYELTLGEPGEVDGEPVYVVEGVFSEEIGKQMTEVNPMASPMLGLMGKVAVKIRKSDLFPLETVMSGSSGEAFMTMRNKNFIANPDLDESIFEYTPPEGAEVMDMAEMMNAQQ